MKITYAGDAQEVKTQGITFPKDKAVDVDDEQIIARLSNNKYFKVEEAKKAPTAKKAKETKQVKNED